MSTGAAAAAAARRAERRLVEHLRDAGAVNPSSSKPIPDQNWIGRSVFRRLTASGAVREAGGGYYLDEAAYDAFRARRKRNTIIAVSTAAVIAGFVILWASQR